MELYTHTHTRVNLKDKNYGITLISLIVTIIILLILAGITIGLISGSDGILNKATGAVDSSNIATAKEQVELQMEEYQYNFYDKSYVTQELGVAEEKGNWIFENYGNREIKTKDYTFQISLPEGVEKADVENPYRVIILKDNRLKEDVNGTLTVGGVLSWDDEKTGSVNGGGTNGITQEELENQLKQKDEEIKALKAKLDQTDATEENLLEGKKAYSQGDLITGTMQNFAGKTESATDITKEGLNALVTIPKSGFYESSSKLSVPMREITDISSICSNSTIILNKNTQSGGERNINFANYSYSTDTSVSNYNFLIIVASASGARYNSYHEIKSLSVSGGNYVNLGGQAFTRYPSNGTYVVNDYKVLLIPVPREGITVNFNYRGVFGVTVYGIN